MGQQQRRLVTADQVKQWVSERGGRPALSGGRVGEPSPANELRIDFGGTEANSLWEIPWAEWLERFDAAELALRVPASDAPDRHENSYALERR